jgi:hypothetical protein
MVMTARAGLGRGDGKCEQSRQGDETQTLHGEIPLAVAEDRMPGIIASLC